MRSEGTGAESSATPITSSIAPSRHWYGALPYAFRHGGLPSLAICLYAEAAPAAVALGTRGEHPVTHDGAWQAEGGTDAKVR